MALKLPPLTPVAPRVIAPPPPAVAAATTPPAVDPAAAAAALAAVASGTPPPAMVAAKPAATGQNIIEFKPNFLSTDFTAGTENTHPIPFAHPDDDQLRVVDVHFDGTNFAIARPENSGITYDVTSGDDELKNQTGVTGLQDDDVIIIRNIPGRTEPLQWKWKTPAIQPAPPALPPAPVPAPTPAPAPAPAPVAIAVAVTAANGLTTPLTLNAKDNALTLSPADICFRVETLRKLSEGVWAAMVANGYQGSIQGLSGVGHTRKGKGDTVNCTGIGYAVVRADNSKVAPTEVCIAAEGTNAEASGLVIKEILAALTAINPADPKDTNIQRVAYLVEEGIKAAHDRIRALPKTDGKPQGTTVQVSIKNEETVVNLWIGDTVGFAIHGATGWRGRYNPAHDLTSMPFTPPDVLKSDGTAIDGEITDEVTWLKAAGAGAKPILLGQEDTYTPAHNTLADNTKAELEQGGWYGMATSRLLGKGLGLGNIRDAILGANADEIYRAPHRIMEKWVKEVDSKKKLQIRGSAISSGQARKSLPELRTMTDGSIALWLSRVPLPRQRDTERKAAIAILCKLRKLKPKEFPVTDQQLQQIELNRLLGAAEIAKWGRYTKDPAVILRVLGIPVTTTTP